MIINGVDMNKKKIIFDVILNIVASAIPIIILQLIIYPIVANKVGNNEYGLIITLVSMFTLFSFSFGSVLNNIRLLQNNIYIEKGIIGDFNVLLFSSIIVNGLIMIFGTVYYEGSFSLVSIVLVIIISGSNLIREYLIVAFRISLNYKAILFNNILLSLGYILGALLFFITGYWQLIFICGIFISLFYIIFNSNLLNEKLELTPLFKATSYKTVVLFISVLMRTSLSYADKLLLFPLLGPKAVSVYYSATIIGKIISMVIAPISSVMLSYFAKMKHMKITSFFSVLTIVCFLGLFGYFFCIWISDPLLNFLYPNWAQESMKLIYITTATAIIGVLGSVIHPFVLKFNDVNWQVVISGTNLFTYIILAVTLYNFYGLIGFCIGLLIATIVRVLLMIAIFTYNYYRLV